jgi:CheY-like chemotaxis protein
VLEARDGDDALRLAERHASPIDLMLTDVVLPTMSGHDLAARIASTQRAMKVIFTSGYSQDAAGDASESAFLQKPFTLDALTTKVREVLDAEAGG